jgi:hypothetical protein
MLQRENKELLEDDAKKTPSTKNRGRVSYYK